MTPSGLVLEPLAAARAVPSLANLAVLAGCTVVGDPALLVGGVADPEWAGAGDMVFVLDDTYRQRAERSTAGFILAEQPVGDRPGLLAAQPRVAMSQVLAAFSPARPAPGIHPAAVVDPSAILAPGVSVGPGCVVGAKVSVGEGTVLHPGVVLYAGTRVGRDCELHAGVIVREACILGDRVVIQPGSVIGSDGFGFVPTADGIVKTPQVGIAVLEDDVEVGANCAIDRATIGRTVVGRGTKLDNMVHVGHNVRLGEYCMLIAQVGISGSTEIGDRCIFGGQSGATGHLKIGDRVTVAARGGVTKDTLPGGITLSGFPARPHKDELKRLAATARLEKRLAKLEAELKALKGERSGL